MGVSPLNSHFTVWPFLDTVSCYFSIEYPGLYCHLLECTPAAILNTFTWEHTEANETYRPTLSCQAVMGSSSEEVKNCALSLQ